MPRRSLRAKLLAIAALGAVALFAWLSLPAPQQPLGEQAGHGHGAGSALAEGVVVGIDRAAGMLTISHGALPNLGMPPMTMGFRVDDAALLATLSIGDRIRFHAGALDGVFVATRLERMPQ